MGIYARYSKLFEDNGIERPDWRVCYYDDCDRDHKVNAVRSVVLTFNENNPYEYQIKWAPFDKLLALEIIDIELNNSITCRSEYKLDSFYYNGVCYNNVDEILITDIIMSDSTHGVFKGTYESVW